MSLASFSSLFYFLNPSYSLFLSHWNCRQFSFCPPPPPRCLPFIIALFSHGCFLGPCGIQNLRKLDGSRSPGNKSRKLSSTFWSVGWACTKRHSHDNFDHMHALLNNYAWQQKTYIWLTFIQAEYHDNTASPSINTLFYYNCSVSEIFQTKICKHKTHTSQIPKPVSATD